MLISNIIVLFKLGMAVLDKPDDLKLLDGSEMKLSSFDSSIRSSRHLLRRKISLKKQRATQYDVKSSSDIPDVYIIVIVSTFLICLCTVMIFLRQSFVENFRPSPP